MADQRRRVEVLQAVVLVVAVIAATLATSSLRAPVAQAQEIETIEVWGTSSGVVSSPKIWKFRQSASAANDLGSADAADPDLDDSAWADATLRWREFPGPAVANHFRRDFTLDEIGVDIAQITAIQIGLQYDDTAVMYLNGVEVYRSIRGNLDPTYSEYAVGENMPYDVTVPYGGAERFYVQIPDADGVNDCERLPGCTASPYGSPNPPAVPVGLLRADGVNTWAVTTWNQSGGGSGDSSLDHTFHLQIDDTVTPDSPVEDGDTIYVISQASGRYLDGDGPDRGWNTDTSKTPRWDNRWRATDNGDGTWLLLNQRRQRYLDGDAAPAGWNVELSVVARDDDRWELMIQPDGSYLVRNVHFDRYLHEADDANAQLVAFDEIDASTTWSIVLAP